MKAAKIPASRKVDEETLSGLRCPSRRLCCCSPSKTQAGDKRRGVFTVTKSFNGSRGCSYCVSATTVRPSTKLFSIRSLEAWNFLPVSRAFAIFGVKEPQTVCVKRKRGETRPRYTSPEQEQASPSAVKNNRRSGRSYSKKKKKKLENENLSPMAAVFQALICSVVYGEINTDGSPVTPPSLTKLPNKLIMSDFFAGNITEKI